MKIEYDQSKRLWTIKNRGIDFKDAVKVFAGFYLTGVDDRFDYGETRFKSLGAIDDFPVAMVWTLRDGSRRIISMRKADEDEREIYWEQRDRSG